LLRNREFQYYYSGSLPESIAKILSRLVKEGPFLADDWGCALDNQTGSDVYDEKNPE
jgi:hypothetical protein